MEEPLAVGTFHRLRSIVGSQVRWSKESKEGVMASILRLWLADHIHE